MYEYMYSVFLILKRIYLYGNINKVQFLFYI